MKEIIFRTEVLSLKECRSYVKANSKHIGKTDFWTVVNPLKVWKKTKHPSYSGEVIVALNIPVGAEVFMQTDDKSNDLVARKMRASKAFVEKQFYVGWPCLFQDHVWAIAEYEEVQSSESAHYSHFKYHTGKIVTPEYGFANCPVQCTDGIHFFVNLHDALVY